MGGVNLRGRGFIIAGLKGDAKLSDSLSASTVL